MKSLEFAFEVNYPLISTEVTLAGGCMQLAIGWKYPVKKAESRIEAENIVASSLKHPL